ncbi:response regulator [Cytophagaceae bacterium YF14B1]|uniref:Response regulator n=1 Tax=Xanthocytophaga flava TaxID=3048013 RepID=A0AAE3QZU0_9BACT|nr:response regulator [Xanthocytophaga flavus]MDJ1486160.1 response regulator [Xanthocytophaga flavus]
MKIFEKIQTVLVVDDNEVDAIIAQKLLHHSGLVTTVIVYNSVDAAIRFLSTCSLAEQPQVMFLDLEMPDKNGFDFLSILSENPSLLNNNCILYILSSSIHFLDTEKVSTFPRVRQFLHKPMTRQLLTTLFVKHGQ